MNRTTMTPITGPIMTPSERVCLVAVTSGIGEVEFCVGEPTTVAFVVVFVPATLPFTNIPYISGRVSTLHGKYSRGTRRRNGDYFNVIQSKISATIIVAQG